MERVLEVGREVGQEQIQISLEQMKKNMDGLVSVLQRARPWGIRLMSGNAYVLMPNHCHLIVNTPKANLPQFMRHFNVSYAAAFNRRHNRVGHLYQGRYKAIVIDEDSYLLELSRYVHVNPVRVRSYAAKSPPDRIRFLRAIPGAAFPGYVSGQSRLPWVNYDAVLGYVDGSRKRYAEFLSEEVRKGYDSPCGKSSASG